MRNIAYLAHNQLKGANNPRHGFISPEEADYLIQSMQVEQLSRSTIRAFPPDSVFYQGPTLANRLPSIEPDGDKFIPPKPLTLRERLRRRLVMSYAHDFVQGDAEYSL